ncbi:hypothetical protein [Amycolatopsis taiwanensis]|uniref:hypothetical protein n=1 Tax=Amycolatopsis taiwanensis TaxID=342230 RepID=UPI0025530469|nr:hypothetical protein [Amycolatopsis taiwanensis]
MPHDRFGELVDEDQADVIELPHRCDDGWIDRDADHPQPCPRCRPHLARRPPKPRPHPAVARHGIAAVRAVLANRHHHTEGGQPA